MGHTGLWIAGVLILAACRVAPGSPPSSPAPGTRTPPGTPAPSATPALAEVVVYFPDVRQNEVIFVAVPRHVPTDRPLPQAAVEALLRGPRPEERRQGLDFPIPQGTRLLELTISGGVARPNFDARMEFQMGGSLRVMTIRQMIIRTLRQFPEVQEVIIAVEGRTEDVLQP